MVVRIRLSFGKPRRTAAVVQRQAALVASLLMTPVALTAWALGGWRLAADMKWTGEFAIEDGLFSHWQVWIAVGIAVQFASFLLQRYARRDEDTNDRAFG
jgi:hypothetical protein